MKHLFLLMLSALIFTTAKPCHIDPLGTCGELQFYQTKDFEPNGVYYIRYKTDTLATFTTGTKVHDSIFSLQIPVGGQIYLKYTHAKINDWIGWNSQPFALSTQYSGCQTLPVTLYNIWGGIEKGHLKVNFRADNESNIKSYKILVSEDGLNFTEVKEIPATGAKIYAANIPLAIAAAFFLPVLLFVRKKKHILYVLAFLLLSGSFYACKKDVVKNVLTKDYQFMQIKTVSNDGSTALSEVIKL